MIRFYYQLDPFNKVIKPFLSGIILLKLIKEIIYFILVYYPLVRI